MILAVRLVAMGGWQLPKLPRSINKRSYIYLHLVFLL